MFRDIFISMTVAMLLIGIAGLIVMMIVSIVYFCFESLPAMGRAEKNISDLVAGSNTTAY
ncbi:MULTISPECIES: hypothetical protein [unclassified Breznakia]|uniref:hypothetical protein n=1 Tax=unclassified Breznakia TaxID=2623764 RepID=UPI002474EC7D|nr:MULTISPECIES: hypothetical protein [unclassified Breznakia]MDH6367045.1 hypothetical protein [Breznakia sp. PH1-1]MDH6404183.1 hypothetical protein [Breznakia sp. PF1-11]MDH6411932.1 hypothetical protein [Breznakia sp. PFB1-11]MDH6414171.1 hypothetical protein [Breznakia sp. PFB1-14]MDH6418924.1 hypothetical protein [Breznakia sp. PFB1-12]